MSNTRLVTAESVRRGHPDKFCDQIADRILDAHLASDPNARVAVEVFATAGKVIVAGEVTSSAQVNYRKIVWELIGEIGYIKGDTCLDPLGHLDIDVLIHEQSPDIAQAVASEGQLGAGDQGIMVGYATDETPEFLPLPVVLAHKVCRRLDNLAREVHWLGADGKAQITVSYEDEAAKEITAIIISVQHTEDADLDCLRERIRTDVVESVTPAHLITENTLMLINPSGKFVLGGPAADTGLTGRKLAVDSYGPVAHIGGGAYCVDSETEFLTPTGWKRIANYQPGDMVAQWDADELSFVHPLEYIKTPAKGMHRLTSDSALDMVLSDNHDLVLITGKGNVIKKRLKEFMPDGMIQNGHFGTIPTSFSYHHNGDGTPFSDAQIRLQVAFCADGSIQDKRRDGRIRVKRERKKQRIEALLREAEVPYRKTEDGDYSIYWFVPPVASKSLADTFWPANSKQLAIIAEEAPHWDGDVSQMIYRTTKKVDADFMQFAMMATYSRNVSIIMDDRIGELYSGKYTRRSIGYEVRVKKNKGTGFRYGPKSKPVITCVPYATNDPYMYCFSVDAGMLVLRRNDRVFITGNSGKDATKVDRSGAYAARWIAKCIVAASLARRCEVQIAYAIGRAVPVGVSVDTFQTGTVSDTALTLAVQRTFDLRPASLIDQLHLRTPIYSPLAVYGHYGHDDLSLPWENTDMKTALLRAVDQIVK